MSSVHDATFTRVSSQWGVVKRERERELRLVYRMAQGVTSLCYKEWIKLMCGQNTTYREGEREGVLEFSRDFTHAHTCMRVRRYNSMGNCGIRG